MAESVNVMKGNRLLKAS